MTLAYWEFGMEGKGMVKSIPHSVDSISPMFLPFLEGAVGADRIKTVISKFYASQGSKCPFWALPGHVYPENLSLGMSGTISIVSTSVSLVPTGVPTYNTYKIIIFWLNEFMEE